LDPDLTHAWLAYLGITAGLFFTGLGLPPIPEEVLIIGAAGLASHGEVYWWLAWPACVVGIVASDLVLYTIGRFGGRRLLEAPLLQRLAPPARRQQIEEGFHKHGVKILLTARLLPGVRTGVFMTAGAIRFPWVKFLIADGLYAIPGSGTIFFLAFWFVEWAVVFVAELHKAQHWVLAAAIVLGGGYGLYRYLRFQRSRSAAGDFSLPHLDEIVPGMPHHHPKAETPPAAATPPPAGE
jgi:membrane protein DedA with SNARE-associated domain